MNSAISSAQCRAARALLGWSRRRLAEAARVSERTVYDFERDARKPHYGTLATIRQALERNGIVFLGDDGVRLSRDGES